MKFLPYLAIEIVMPGGTLLAIGLWLYRNRKRIFGRMSNWRPAVRLVQAEPN
jgi:hypothetical protein